MFNGQMELGFEKAGAPRSARSQNRSARAGWWFERMRHVVSQAVDWSTPAKPRPEQTWLSGVNRQPLQN